MRRGFFAFWEVGLVTGAAAHPPQIHLERRASARVGSWLRRHRISVSIVLAAFSAGGYVTTHERRTTDLAAQVSHLDTVTVKKDTFALFQFQVLGELHAIRVAVDSMNQRQRDFFCQDKPRWCR